MKVFFWKLDTTVGFIIMFVFLNIVKNFFLLFEVHEILRFAQEDKVMHFKLSKDTTPSSSFQGLLTFYNNIGLEKEIQLFYHANYSINPIT